jgi:hypothetical protein
MPCSRALTGSTKRGSASLNVSSNGITEQLGNGSHMNKVVSFGAHFTMCGSKNAMGSFCRNQSVSTFSAQLHPPDSRRRLTTAWSIWR